MLIDDFLGYKLTCKMSAGLKNEANFSDREFTVIFSKDDKSDSGYTAMLSGINLDDEPYEDQWDGEVVGKNILFGNWVIVSKQKG